MTSATSIRVDDHRDERSLASFRPAREHDVEVGDPRVRDPGLHAVEDDLVSLAPSDGAHREDVTPGVGLRERERGDGFAARDEREISGAQLG
jgi:hypothetical protein